jgi:hypothetical protein
MLAHDKTGANTMAKAAKPEMVVALSVFIPYPPLSSAKIEPAASIQEFDQKAVLSVLPR